MHEKHNDQKFPISDKLWWWGSNILALIASVILLLSYIVSIPFRNYKSKLMKYIFRIAFICLLLLTTVGFYLYLAPNQNESFGEESKFMIIQRGETVSEISFKLKRLGAISSEFNFIVFSKIFDHSRKLKAGRYSIEPDYSLRDIFNILTSGASAPFNVTILEGLTIKEIGDNLSRTLSFSADEFTKNAEDRTLIDSLDINQDNLEGYLFPETYNFFYDETPRSVITKMINQFYSNLPDSFEARAKMLGLDFNEAVIIASLIESEAMLDSERPIISAVYHKRLKIGMRLQCDPTVIYALGGLDRPLYKRDLQCDSPYNTYKYYGLPPGPICSPRSASLEAAINPAKVDFLYFVAKGDGSHIFSRTNRDHINAKNKIKRDKRKGLFN